MAMTLWLGYVIQTTEQELKSLGIVLAHGKLAGKPM
jgi:hypothetical protein